MNKDSVEAIDTKQCFEIESLRGKPTGKGWNDLDGLPLFAAMQVANPTGLDRPYVSPHFCKHKLG